MVAVVKSPHVQCMTAPVLLVRRGRLIETYSSRMQRLNNSNIIRRSKEIRSANSAKHTSKVGPKLPGPMKRDREHRKKSKNQKRHPRHQLEQEEEGEEGHCSQQPRQVLPKHLAKRDTKDKKRSQPRQSFEAQIVPSDFISATEATTRTRSAKQLRLRSDSIVTLIPKRRSTMQIKNLPPARPNGLRNTGNYCYRRSLTQALLHCPELLAWLENEASDHKHPSTGHRCLACGLHRLAEAIWCQHDASSAVANFDGMLKSVAFRHPHIQWLRSSAQHDSHEVFTFLVGALAADCGVTSCKTLKSIFHLTTSGTWTCTTCQTTHTSPTASEPGLQLGIQIAPPSASDLHTHLAAYFSQHVPDMTCERPNCASKATRTRNIAITSFPRVLVIQLARFSQTYDPKRGKFTSRKCSRAVRYPLDLDLGEFAVQEMRDDEFWASRDCLIAKYRLASVVAHAGSLDFGHYVAYAQGPAGVMKLDDERVGRCSVDEMLCPEGGFTPYLLVYRCVV